MKFLVEVDIEVVRGASKISKDQLREHLQTYVFGELVENELSLLPNDPDHEKGTYEDYVIFMFRNANVEVV